MSAPDPQLAAMLRRVSDAAAKRGERTVGYYGDLKGHFRFDFAPIARKRARREQPAPPPRSVTRGVRAERQGSLL